MSIMWTSFPGFGRIRSVPGTVPGFAGILPKMHRQPPVHGGIADLRERGRGTKRNPRENCGEAPFHVRVGDRGSPGQDR